MTLKEIKDYINSVDFDDADFAGYGMLDKLMKHVDLLEAVANAAHAFIHSDGDYWSWTEDERHKMSDLGDAVNALEGGG